MQLLTNSFQLPGDGWYQISALGEFPHNPTGLVQIVDEASCRAMTDHFVSLSSQPNFAGILIDFDHFSLEKDKPSTAAGWITALEHRPNGLWAQIRWSDEGEQAVKGGRYRFISPVWRQDECEDLGNKRVRPLKLVNAAVTNDPNIRGMMPLSNRTASETRIDSRPFAVSNRSAASFTRAIVLTNASPMTDDQRKAMFARLRGGGGGSRNTGGASSSASGSSGYPVEQSSGAPQSANEVLEQLSQEGYDPAGGENLSHITPLGEQPQQQPDPSALPGQSGATPGVTYDPVRASEDRIRAIEQQRDALISQRPPEPKQPDFSIVDIRKLEKELYAQGRSTNEVAAAVKAAQAQNIAHKAALERIKHDIRKAYPNDKAKQAQALSKYMQQLNAQYQKQHDAWQKVSDKIDAAVVKASAMIEEERARGMEEARLAQQKTRNAAATRTQKVTDAQERERLKQVAADKAEARRKVAEKAKAKTTTTKSRTARDDVSDMTAEMKRRQFYWQSLARGEVETAKSLYPAANHDENLKTLGDLTPPSTSKANVKAYKAALVELEKAKP